MARGLARTVSRRARRCLMRASARVTRNALSMRCWVALLALSLLPARAGAEGSTLPAEKVGACALLTAADAPRVSNVPMEFQTSAPGNASPGRNWAYRPVRPGPGRGIVQLQLLDAREWSRFKSETDGSRLEMESVSGIGDEAYVVRKKRAKRTSALVLFVRRGGSQFSVSFGGAG